MQRPFYLINTARGAHVDTAALVQGLAQGKVLGACLDVLEYEKSSFEGLTADAMPAALAALLRSEQVVLSPHVAGWTVESYEKLSAYLAEKILREH
jgi:D-3-phosphoglycerate dehydrogenase